MKIELNDREVKLIIEALKTHQEQSGSLELAYWWGISEDCIALRDKIRAAIKEQPKVDLSECLRSI